MFKDLVAEQPVGAAVAQAVVGAAPQREYSGSGAPAMTTLLADIAIDAEAD